MPSGSANGGRGKAAQHLTDPASKPVDARPSICSSYLCCTASGEPLAWSVSVVSTFVHTNICRSAHMARCSRTFRAFLRKCRNRRQREQYVGDVRARPRTRTCALVCLMISVSYPSVCMGTSGGPRRHTRGTFFSRRPTLLRLGPLWVLYVTYTEHRLYFRFRYRITHNETLPLG